MKSIEQLRAEIKARIIDIYNNVKEEDFIYSDGIVEGLLMVYTQLFDDVKDVDSEEINKAHKRALRRIVIPASAYKRRI